MLGYFSGGNLRNFSNSIGQLHGCSSHITWEFQAPVAVIQSPVCLKYLLI